MATIVTGIASTPEVDAQRHSVVRGAFDLTKSVPLLWRHQPGDECGRIIRLAYVGDELHVRALVNDDDKAARATGFSVSFGLLEYEIRNKGRDDYHARVSKARLDEISLVLNPANRACVIRSRERSAWPARAPGAEMLDRQIQLAGLLREFVGILQKAHQT
jgi:hypothetical protein